MEGEGGEGGILTESEEWSSRCVPFRLTQSLLPFAAANCKLVAIRFNVCLHVCHAVSFVYASCPLSLAGIDKVVRSHALLGLGDHLFLSLWLLSLGFALEL